LQYKAVGRGNVTGGRKFLGKAFQFTKKRYTFADKFIVYRRLFVQKLPIS
jgi:hypothetical protein